MPDDRIYYRGFDSQYPNLGCNESYIWLTDSIDFAREYTKGRHSLAELIINIKNLKCADEYDIEWLEYDFDYDLYQPDETLCQQLRLNGYNAYLIYSTHQDEMLCLLDKTLVKRIEILN